MLRSGLAMERCTVYHSLTCQSRTLKCSNLLILQGLLSTPGTFSMQVFFYTRDIVPIPWYCSPHIKIWYSPLTRRNAIHRSAHTRTLGYDMGWCWSFILTCMQYCRLLWWRGRRRKLLLSTLPVQHELYTCVLSIFGMTQLFLPHL
jgi:hypothetical protein